MRRDEAIARLIEIAKASIETVDGEWGCGHSFGEALANEKEPTEWDWPGSSRVIECSSHERAVEVDGIEKLLRGEQA
jgi:hypothetical protein